MAHAAKLLIVADDNADMRWLVRTALRDRFDEIFEAGDGRALFWELVKSANTRSASEVFVVTDIRMPVYSGLDVLAIYDELDYHPATVVITSFPSEDVVAAVERAGAALLAKPFGTADLREAVDARRQ